MTRHQGTLHGSGFLLGGDSASAPVSYSIEVFAHDQMKYGIAEVSTSFEVIEGALLGEKLILKLETGGQLRVLITDWDRASRRAKFETNENVPGF